jgi:hypothetical protein
LASFWPVSIQAHLAEVVKDKSQKASMNWKKFTLVVDKWLTPAKRVGPDRSQRMAECRQILIVVFN